MLELQRAFAGMETYEMMLYRWYSLAQGIRQALDRLFRRCLQQPGSSTHGLLMRLGCAYL